MLRRFSIDFALFSMFLDMAIVAGMLALATYLRPEFSALSFVQWIGRPFQIPLPLYVVFPVVWVFVLQLHSVYDGRRNLQFIKELTSLTAGSFLAMVTSAGALYLSFRDVSRFLFLTFALGTYLLLVFWRLVYRSAYHWGMLHHTPARRILIVGSGILGREFEQRVRSYQQLGYQVVGFLDDDSQKRQKHPDIIGSLREARYIVERHKVDDVIIALPPRAVEQVNRLVAELHILPVKVWVIPDYFHLALHKAEIEEFAGIPMLDLRAPALNDYQRLVKRIFDLAIVIFFLPGALLLMGIISLIIWLEDGHPILFKQDRVGENGRLFKMLKFRTMQPDAEAKRGLVERVDENGCLIHKVPDDPRVTRIGRFLRQTSLDELPQIFNILKGEMSLVGPRPELPYLVDRYETWQRKRFTVPQGLTGWWQINGRSNRPMHLHTEDDLYYVQNYSLLLDVQILLRTISVVLRGKGAY